MKTLLRSIWTLLCLWSSPLLAREVQEIQILEEDFQCSSPIDLVLKDPVSPLKDGVTLDLQHDDAWLFFEAMKPSVVLRKYGHSIQIKGKPLQPAVNARIGMYKQGTVLMPHGADFQPLRVFSEKEYAGTATSFALNTYYSNEPGQWVSDSMKESLELDNQIQSFQLKRGYMATFANDPDGMGYSRVYIAEKEDLEIPELPELLAGKISFVRVFKWEYTSKKGWAGSVWKEIIPGLRYVEEQCEITHSTWYYNWSATTGWTSNPDRNTANYDVEFVPEKWGAGGSWNEIFNIKDASHLMGYNEPDHSEQSNVSVAKALEEWPYLIQTGMRLGSPATTDFSWLYSFMNECKRKNYRVDYVVIHAYWAGLSPHEWYSRLKEVHDRTGRPLWIKEWNNGANWTKESWPSGTEAQQAKQLNDLKGILHVMDTARFIERYSIYNWVEEKRALLLSTGKLTPAGEYYAENTPGLSFNREKEFIPDWQIRESPVAAYSGYDPEAGYTLSFSDYNGELIEKFCIERAFETDLQISFSSGFKKWVELPFTATSYTDTPEQEVGKVFYRVCATDYLGNEKMSNILSYEILDNSKQEPITGYLSLHTPWAVWTVNCSYPAEPTVVLGASTFVNKSPLSMRVRNLSSRSFEWRLAPYSYLENPVYSLPDTTAYIVIPEGFYNWGSIQAQAATVKEIGTEWKRICFAHPFLVEPVVFSTQISDQYSAASVVRVRNITVDGFEACLQYEKSESDTFHSETISYLAATPGKGNYGDRKIEVGRTPQGAVGEERTGIYRIVYSESYRNPLFFGSLQTDGDGIAAVLRIYNQGATYAEVLKDYERSAGYTVVEKETAGWMVIGEDEPTDLKSSESVPSVQMEYISSEELITLHGCTGPVCIGVYDLAGQRLLFQTGNHSLSISGLPPGIYLVKASECTGRLIRK